MNLAIYQTVLEKHKNGRTNPLIKGPKTGPMKGLIVYSAIGLDEKVLINHFHRKWRKYVLCYRFIGE